MVLSLDLSPQVKKLVLFLHQKRSRRYARSDLLKALGCGLKKGMVKHDPRVNEVVRQANKELSEAGTPFYIKRNQHGTAHLRKQEEGAEQTAAEIAHVTEELFEIKESLTSAVWACTTYYAPCSRCARDNGKKCLFKKALLETEMKLIEHGIGTHP